MMIESYIVLVLLSIIVFMVDGNLSIEAFKLIEHNGIGRHLNIKKSNCFLFYHQGHNLPLSFHYH